jgi:hypothetical protein
MTRTPLVAAAWLLCGLAGVVRADLVVDLISGNGGTINQVVFSYLDPNQSTGTGTIDPFLRLQRNGSEEGVNTTATSLDEKDTDLIQFAAIAATTLDGTAYRVFFLDVNEQNSRPYLSLDGVRIWASSSAGETYVSLSGQSPLYDLDEGGNNTVLLDASRNSGSGDGDMLMYVPSAFFAGVADTSYLYLYSLFGAYVESGPGARDFQAGGGFEEWASAAPFVQSPEPTSAGLLMLAGLLYFGLIRRLCPPRRRLAIVARNSEAEEALDAWREHWGRCGASR